MCDSSNREMELNPEALMGEGDCRNQIPLLETFFLARTATALEDALRADSKYRSACNNARRKCELLSKIGLNDEQWTAVDRALSAESSATCERDRITYSLGFKDAVRLLKETFE